MIKKLNMKVIAVLAMFSFIIVGIVSCETDDFAEVPATPYISQFAITSPINATASIDEEAKTIEVTVPQDTDLSNVVVDFTTSEGATVDPEPGSTVDFSAGHVNFHVSKGFKTVNYEVNVYKAGVPKLSAFRIIEPVQEVGTVNQTLKKASAKVPIGTDLSALTVEFDTNEGATVSPESGSIIDFSNGPVAVTVSYFGATTTYEVSVQERAEPTINSFSITSPVEANGSIDQENKRVTVSVPGGTDLSAVEVNLALPNGATVTPTANGVVDFSNGPVTFTVTLNNNSVDYVVTVTEPQIIAFLGSAASISALSEADTKAAAEFLRSYYGENFIYLENGNFTAEDLEPVQVVVYYYDNTGSFDNPDGSLTAASITALTNYVKNGGNMFLGGFGTRIIDDLGRIPYEPGIAGNGAGGPNPDNWGMNTTTGLPTDVMSHPAMQGLSLTDEIVPGESIGHNFVPFINPGYKEDHNSMWDLGAVPELTEPHASVARGAEFEELTTSRILGTWQHVTDLCCIAAIEFLPTATYEGRIIAIGIAAYEWEMNDGRTNEFQANVENFTTNSINYMMNN
ncbi:DUF4960 domain-containing protein [Salinimicrobium sediminilitoris]|uniref:DUF4960 domain-containing protein n=1 Tax=Salinimicrobium sediminilitoris TaxID=2876715 RepID=UPI001E2D1EA8|nr:DUF4960 domain-containing protein [Salinimicrobium sediminilitoris]MCC8360643.1 DUF4960 domain-containing protein [Salinimicrobium sediminilitoris]